MSESPRNEGRWSGGRAAALEVAAIVGISLAVVCLVSCVPFSQDSYFYYQNLAWARAPLTALDPFTRKWDLALYGARYLPLRSYTYVGSLPSLFYLPLFLLWPSPHSARLMGLFMIGLQAAILHRIFGFRTLACFALLLLCMPYSLQHIIDTGPTAYPITIMYLIVLLIGGWFRSTGKGGARGTVYPAAIAGLVLLGIWCKLSFIYYLPVIPLFMLHYAMENRRALATSAARKRLLLHCIVLVSIAGILTAALLGAKDRSGETRYYECAPLAVNAALDELPYAYTPWRQFVYISKYFTNPLQSSNFIYQIDHTATTSGIALCTTIVTLLAYGTLRLRRAKKEVRFIAVNALAFTIVLIGLISNAAAFSMHHVIMVCPFVLMAMFTILSKLRGDRIISLLLALFLLLNAYQWYMLSALNYRGWEKAHRGHALVANFEPLNERLNAYSSRYVFVHTDWGLYSLKALYGNRGQCNIASWPLVSEDGVRLVKEICAKTRRRPMFIRIREGSGTDFDFLKKHFPGIVPMSLDFDAGSWELWYEPIFNDDAPNALWPPPGPQGPSREALDYPENR